jgi:hypothetical protein
MLVDEQFRILDLDHPASVRRFCESRSGALRGCLTEQVATVEEALCE